MNYTMTIPCHTCPFRREGGVRLTTSRVREIAGMMLDSQGGEFPCHKSVDYDRDDDHDDGNNDGRRISDPTEVHCAGALIFAERQKTATQMMRIMERIGLYDAAKLMANEEVVTSVFGSLREMLAANRGTRSRSVKSGD